MKNQITLLFAALLLLPVILFSQSTPAVKTLHCPVHDLANLRVAVQKREPVEHIVFEGKGSRSQWKRALKQASSLESLQSVTFANNEFDVLPVAVHALSRVKKISIVENDLIDLEASVDMLVELKQLSCFEIEVYALDELPENIALLIQLDSLIARSPEYTDYLNSILPGDQITIKYEVFEVPGALSNKTIGQRIYCIEENLEIEISTATTEVSSSVKPCLKKSYTSFQPPVADLDIPVAIFSIDPTQSQKLMYSPSGTELTIPGNAFVDDSGNPITTRVDIDYREFRDPVDFLASGIPMSFNDTDSGLSYFSSAGMFDVFASADGKEVFLQPGKIIDINFASTDSINAFNFYQYNDAEAKWEEKGDAPLAPTTSDVSALSWAWVNYEGLMNKKVVLGDTTFFADRFESNNYFHTRKKMLGTKKAPLYSNKNKQRFRMNNLVKIRSIRKTHDGEIVFKIKTRRMLHPEMQAFNNQEWQLTSVEDIGEFRKNYGYRHKFNDIRVSKDGDGYAIRLKDDSSHADIGAITVFRTEENHRAVYKPSKANYKIYKNTLKNRQRNLDKKIIRQKKLYQRKEVAGYQRKQKLSWRKSRRYMSPDERDLSFDEWQLYYANVRSNSLQGVSQFDRRAGFRRAVQISSFGLYNCDQIMQTPAPPQNIYVNFLDTDNNTLAPLRAYVLDARLNSIITLSEKIDQDKLFLSVVPQKNQQLVLLTEDNQFAMCSLRDFSKKLRNTPQGGTISLRIDKPSIGTNRLNEIRALLQL